MGRSTKGFDTVLSDMLQFTSGVNGEERRMGVYVLWDWG